MVEKLVSVEHQRESDHRNPKLEEGARKEGNRSLFTGQKKRDAKRFPNVAELPRGRGQIRQETGWLGENSRGGRVLKGATAVGHGGVLGRSFKSEIFSGGNKFTTPGEKK